MKSNARNKNAISAASHRDQIFKTESTHDFGPPIHLATADLTDGYEY